MRRSPRSKRSRPRTSPGSPATSSATTACASPPSPRPATCAGSSGTCGCPPEMSAVDADGIATRHPDLVLARLHLRLGSLALARAELETLAGQDALDEDGLVDLAEARWRTGDIAGAGEAAV